MPAACLKGMYCLQTVVKEKETSTKPEVSIHKYKRLSVYWTCTIILTVVTLLVNVTFLSSRKACDFYLDHVFRFTGGLLARITGIFPFSCGEVLITAGIIILIAALMLSILSIIMRNHHKLRRFTARYLKTVLVIALSVFLIFTLNCTVMYCSTPMYFDNDNREFDVETLEAVRNEVVEQCNELCRVVKRDENHTMIFEGNADKAASDALRGISDEFPRLSGYYPQAKSMMGSYFMYKSSIIGVYFPFSMEANYSKYVSDSYMPHVIAHEYSHLKGYIYESEANFMSYLACTRSNDPAVRYSGYLCVLYYIDSDYKNSVSDERYSEQPEIDVYVRFDDCCYDKETYEYLKSLNEKKQPKVAEIAENVSDQMMDSYMDALDYKPNYSEVTLLMMQYYTERGNI